MSRSLIKPKKSFGQNFLSDESIIEQLVSLISPRCQDHLVEIGPGLGAITLPLLPLVAKIDAIELDKQLVPILQQKALGKGELVIHQQDALFLDLSSLSKQAASLRIIGNLPYNITTPLLFHLFNQRQYIVDMHFMVQKEVAERLTANPGNKQYGRLTVMAQYYCHIESLLLVPPHAFRPRPKVDSAFIRLMPQTSTLLAKDMSLFDGVVKEAFSHRRKTIGNALKQLITKEQLIALDINPLKRPEELSIEKFVIISNLL
jgi:16S rRNA (adenine1518-N6/adenine1519-N6)-dimethyltransferase